MLIGLPRILTTDQLDQARALIERADWKDGRLTSGYQANAVKRNQQLAEEDPIARKLGATILESLERNPLFVSAALPLKVFPPMFNRYGTGEEFGRHVDTALRQVAGTPHRVRTDLSATLFLSEPDEYEGGELAIDDTFGVRQIKLAAGDMVLYPGTSVHRVMPITKGVRLAAVFWIQSVIREDSRRSLLFELDGAIQELAAAQPALPALVRFTNVYHNLLRHWAEA
jgi:PKHD-type hydroxylase